MSFSPATHTLLSSHIPSRNALAFNVANACGATVSEVRALAARWKVSDHFVYQRIADDELVAWTINGRWVRADCADEALCDPLSALAA